MSNTITTQSFRSDDQLDRWMQLAGAKMFKEAIDLRKDKITALQSWFEAEDRSIDGHYNDHYTFEQWTVLVGKFHENSARLVSWSISEADSAVEVDIAEETTFDQSDAMKFRNSMGLRLQQKLERLGELANGQENYDTANGYRWLSKQVMGL